MNNFQDISREITSEQDMALAEEAKELARLELLEELNQAEGEGEEDEASDLSQDDSETSSVNLQIFAFISTFQLVHRSY